MVILTVILPKVRNFEVVHFLSVVILIVILRKVRNIIVNFLSFILDSYLNLRQQFNPTTILRTIILMPFLMFPIPAVAVLYCVPLRLFPSHDLRGLTSLSPIHLLHCFYNTLVSGTVQLYFPHVHTDLNNSFSTNVTTPQYKYSTIQKFYTLILEKMNYL